MWYYETMIMLSQHVIFKIYLLETLAIHSEEEITSKQ